MSSITGVIAISGGWHHSLALKSDGTVWAWGHNSFGELGNGTTTDSRSPVQVSGLTGVSAIASTGGASLALKNNGTVLTWGLNDKGQLGDGTTVNRNTPALVSSLSGITAIANGNHSFSQVLKNDGTVWMWGVNTDGQLGDGTTTDRTTPMQVTGLCQVSQAVNEITEPLSISVFPNPSSGIFSLQSETKISSIEIINVFGEKVYEVISNSLPSGGQGWVIDLSTQPNGIYFLNIKTAQGTANKKLIINK